MTDLPPSSDADPVGRPSTVPVPVGYRVGRWEVTRPIASGAWGSVYAARRRSEDEPRADDEPRAEGAPGTDDAPPPDGDPAPGEVALKFLATAVHTPRLPVHLEDLVRRETSGTELRHERLVRTYDVLTVRDPATPCLDGAVVLVMELAEGSLADRIAAGAGAPLPDAGRALREIAQGLAWMHGSGWVHGDLKPGNVLVRADGGHCLADFGLAGALDGTHAYVPPVASPDFAPPERRLAVATAEGQQIRPSGDVWSFGVIACLALTGRMPLPGQTPWARAEAATEYVGGMRSLALPDALAGPWRELVTDCLDPDPARRPTAVDLVTRVEAAAAAGPAGCEERRSEHLRPWNLRPGQHWPGHRWPQVVVATGGAVVLAVLVWQVVLPHDAPAPTASGTPAAASPSASSSKPVVPPGTCVQRPREQRDAYTGTDWHLVWYCRNDAGAPQYSAPDGRDVVGWIETTTSWFLCYRRGARGPDGRTIWYYTQGDRTAAGWLSRHAWGYTSSAFVRATVHPYPGIPLCPAGT